MTKLKSGQCARLVIMVERAFIEPISILSAP